MLHAFAVAVTIVAATSMARCAVGADPSRSWPSASSNATTTKTNGDVAARDDDDVILSGFVSWFQAHGGWMHPQLSLAEVPSYGGWGLVSDSPMEARTTILRVPSSLILTRDRATHELLMWLQQRQRSSNQPSDLAASILEQKDDVETMALYLWTESCRPSASFWDPYLRIVLPNIMPPLLFAMDDQALELLGDDGLQQLARDTSTRVDDLWKRFRHLVVEPESPTERCDGSLEGFRKCFAFVTSHGMSVGSQIILVPMADMINHNPIPGTAASNHNSIGVMQEPAFDFQQFHVLHGNGSMTVTTDQLTIPVAVENEGDFECLAGGREAASAADNACHSEAKRSRYRHMVVEQYSELDTSLYMEKFGFVPDRNEHHCVLLTLFTSDEPGNVTLTVCVKANGRLPTVRSAGDQNHELQAMLELLRGLVKSVPSMHPTVDKPQLETTIEKHDYERIQQCFRTTLNSNDQRQTDLLSCDEAVVWQVWRRLVRRAATERLADLQQRQRSMRTGLSESIPTQVQLAMKFVQSDIDVLQSLTHLDVDSSSA